jgi:hypothetical protein
MEKKFVGRNKENYSIESYLMCPLVVPNRTILQKSPQNLSMLFCWFCCKFVLFWDFAVKLFEDVFDTILLIAASSGPKIGTGSLASKYTTK